MRVRPFVVLGSVVMALMAGTVGRVAAAAASPSEAAEPLVQEGIAFRSAFRDLEALEKFQRAYEIAKTPRIEAQIGAAEQALGRWVEAETHVSHALGAASDPWIIKNRPTLETALAAIRSHIGTLEILGKPVGTEIRVDGEVVGRLPLSNPLHLPAGRTTIELRAPGHFTVTRTVTIEAEKPTRETVVLPSNDTGAPSSAAVSAGGDTTPASTKAEPTTVKTDGPAELVAHTSSGTTDVATAGGGIGWRRPTEIATAGLAVVGLALGIVEHLKWQDKIDSFEHMSACGLSAPNYGGATCQTLHADGQSARNLAFISYGAAAALGATAAILYFTEPARGAGGQAVACAPAALARGVECVVRF